MSKFIDMHGQPACLFLYSISIRASNLRGGGAKDPTILSLAHLVTVLLLFTYSMVVIG